MKQVENRILQRALDLARDGHVTAGALLLQFSGDRRPLAEIEADLKQTN